MHPSGEELTIILKNCRNGEKGARDYLFTVSRQRISQLTGQMLKNYRRVVRWEQQDDVVQQVCLRLLKSMCRDDPPQTTRDYYRLAAYHVRHELLNLARSYFGPQGLGENYASVAGQDVPLLDPAQSVDDPEKLQFWTLFHETIEQLPAEDREYFDLLWYQGLEQKVVADLLGVNERTVRRRWLALKLQLHDKLGGSIPVEA